MMTGKYKTKTNLKTIEGDFRVGKETDEKYGQIRDDGASVLVTTDALAEGIDLNRAGLVVNYDIPWNPTIVIQRVGRVNRIVRKVFDNIFVYNFFPTAKGEDVNRTRQIARAKLKMIHSIVAEDAQLLDVSEIPRAADSKDVESLLGEEGIDAAEKAQQSDVSCVNDRLKRCKDEFEEFFGGTKSWDQKLQEIDDLPESGIQTVVKNEATGPKELVIFEFVRNGWSCLHVDDIDIHDTHRIIGLLNALDIIRCSPWTRTDQFDTHWEGTLAKTTSARALSISSEYEYGHPVTRKTASDPLKKADERLRILRIGLPTIYDAQISELENTVWHLDISKWELKTLSTINSTEDLVEFIGLRGLQKISGTPTTEEEVDRESIAAIGIVVPH